MQRAGSVLVADDVPRAGGIVITVRLTVPSRIARPIDHRQASVRACCRGVDQFGPGMGEVTFGRTTGLGDIQWMNYLATNEGVKPPDIFGIGVGLLITTATSEWLGAGKWAAGPAAVAVHLGDKWMYGVVAQHFWAFAGDERRNDINLTALQPILRYALSEETGIGVMQNWNYNWESRRWTQLFVGLGIDTVVNLGPVPTQIGIEFHYNLARNDVFNPE